MQEIIAFYRKKTTKDRENRSVIFRDVIVKENAGSFMYLKIFKGSI